MNDTDSGPAARLTSIIGAIVALVLLIMFGLQDMATPAAVPASAAPSAFSSARALVHLRRIAATPHPVGTAENAQVRNYLLGQLTALGLAPQVQSALGILVAPHANVAGHVHNIALRIPGRVPGKALMLAAHYDSVTSGPGAADDGASVAAILETIRALQAGAALQNDVICLFTDGEEVGLLGAQAFAAAHPWARDVGLVLNFEYRGNSGPMLMFETSTGNGKLIDGLATLRHPVGNSVMYEVYRLLPNNTDMTVFKGAGMAGMNFAAIERPTSYHSQLDTPELLNEGTLQHEGDSMLALARYFGNADLGRLAAPNRIYFDLPVLGLVNYPASLALPLAGLLVLLFGAVLFAGLRSGALRAGGSGAATLLFPLIGAAVAGAGTLLWRGVTLLHPGYLLVLEPYNGHWYMLALLALATGLFSLIQSRLQRWIRPAELALGAALLWIVLLLASALLVPGASFLLTWPLLPVLLALGWLFSRTGARMSAEARLVLLLCAAAPGVILFAPLLRNLFIALTFQMAGVAIFALLLLLGLLTPLLALLARRRLWPALPLLAGLCCLLAGSLTARPSAAQPQPDSLFYVQDGMAGKAWWLSGDAALDGWLRPIFGAHPLQRRMPQLPGERLYWVAPAPGMGVPAPSIEVLHDAPDGKLRSIVVRIRSLRGAPQLRVFAEGATVMDASLHGHRLWLAPQKEWTFAAYGFPPEGAELTLKVVPGQPFRLRVFDRTYGLPPAGLAARGADMISQPMAISDSVLAVRVQDFK